MSEFTKYDGVLTSILENEKSILGFLSAIFNFLARRTDFYYVPDGPYENMGFPPGVAEELVIKVLRTCDPKNMRAPNGASKTTEVNNEIMCSTVAQEVEVVADNEDEDSDEEQEEQKVISENPEPQREEASSSNQQPPSIPSQKNSDTYNGAERENYSWAQSILDIDITVKLPPNIKRSKDVKVTINPDDIRVVYNNGDVIINDEFPFKIKTDETCWTMSDGKLLIHLEKVQERWWDKLLKNEDQIDLSKIDCSRRLYELPEDHIAKIKELQWNQQQKLKGLPTSDDIRNMEVLKKAWNAKGSPFQGQEFDPSAINFS